MAKDKRQQSFNQPELPPTRNRKLSLTAQLCIFLSVVCCLLYANTLLNGYAFDDPVVIGKNKFVTEGISAIPKLLATPHLLGFYVIPNDLYRPLSLVMFAIEYQFFGLNPMVGHLFNVVTYVACVLLLFLFIDRFFDRKKTAVAFIAAFLFAIHPIHTEVVANVKSRDELLCFAFAFLSLNLFMKYMKDGKGAMLVAGGFALFLSYISKETSIAFIGIIPLLFFFYNNANRKRAIAIMACTFVATAAFIGIREYVLGKYHANIPTKLEFIDNSLAAAPSYFSRIATEAVILGRYLKLMFIPYPLVSDYAFNSIPFASAASPGFWLSIVAYCGLVYVALLRWMKKRNDPWTFAIVFYLGTLLLVSNLPFLIAGELAERFLFFPSVGFCIAMALAIEKWLRQTGTADAALLKNKKVWAVLVPLLLVFGGITIARNTDWKDSLTLFKADAERSPNDSRLHHHLAAALDVLAKGETDSIQQKTLREECIVEYKKALQIYPGYVAALSDLSHVYFVMKISDSAERYMRQLLVIDPKNAVAANNIANINFNEGRYSEALNYFKKSLALTPEISFSYLNVAETFLKMEQYDSAIAWYYKTIAADTTYNGEHIKIASVFMKMNNTDSAVYHYQQNILLLQNNASAINDFGIFYFNLKKYPEAIEQFKKAITTDTHLINAYANLGICYFQTGKYVDAIEVFKRELALEPNNVQDLPYIALSYQKSGKKDSADKYISIIRKINPNFQLPK